MLVVSVGVSIAKIGYRRAMVEIVNKLEGVVGGEGAW